MALIKADRVKESSTSTGNGTFSLAGAATGYRTFASVCIVGDTFFYGISNQTSGEWETGLGTYSATNTLTRTTVHASSNSGAIVTFGAGNKEVFLTASAQYLERIVDNGLLTSTGSSTSIVAVNDGPQPQLDLAFSADKTLTARYGPTPSYSRASTGTYFNASGVLTSAAINAPRFDHAYENGVWVSKGLLIEEQRTNLVPYSQQFENAAWNKSGAVAITADQVTAPDGTLTADLLKPTAGNSTHYLFRQSLSYSSGNNTLSIFAKYQNHRWFVIQYYDAVKSVEASFDLLNGVAGAVGSGASSAISNVGNGWYRLSITSSATSSSGSGYFTVALNSSDAATIQSWNATGNESIAIWGAQLEAGAFPTSYIPTTTSSVVRSADVCQITGSDFSGFWNATEGSIVLEQDLLSYSDPAADQRYFAFAGGSNNPGMTVHYDGGNSFYIENYGYASNASVSLPDISSVFKLAYGFKANNFAASLNGAGPVILSTGTFPGVGTFAKMDIGYQVGATARSSWVQRIRYFNSRLANQTLVQLSGGINNLSYKSITGSGNATVTNNYTNINVSVPNPLPVANGGTGAQTQLAAVTNLISNPPNDGGQYTLASKKTSGTPTFYWVDGTGYAPTLDLLFAADKSLTAYTGPTPSYSRASTGTFFNASGVLSSAAINAPRFDHVYNGSSWVSKGLLIEEQRTNWSLYSTNMDSFTRNILSLGSKVLFLDGTVSASTFYPTTTGAGVPVAYYTMFGSTWSAGTYTQSFFVKSLGTRYAQIYNDSTSDYANFDLTTGTVQSVTGSAGIQNCGNGWYRVWLTTAVASTFTVFNNALMLSDTIPGRKNGTITSTANGLAACGGQMELGAFPTSYIPTTSAAVTRSADVCQITGTDFSGFWNANEGSVAVEFNQLADASKMTNESYVYGFQNAADSEQFILRGQSSGVYYWRSVNLGNIDATAQISSLGQATVKHAAGYKLNDFASTFNGAAVTTDASGAVPVPVALGIGFNWQSSSNRLNGHISRLRYYPVRIPNATLQTLST